MNGSRNRYVQMFQIGSNVEKWLSAIERVEVFCLIKNNFNLSVTLLQTNCQNIQLKKYSYFLKIVSFVAANVERRLTVINKGQEIMSEY